jgi:hypothetical protein
MRFIEPFSSLRMRYIEPLSCFKVRCLDLRTVLLQNEAFEIVLPQNEVNISVLLQGGIYRVVIVNWQLSNEVKAVIDFVGVTVKASKF